MGRRPRDDRGPEQQLLPFAPTRHSVEDWAHALGESLGRPVVVTYGRSRRTPVQIRPDTDVTLHLRLHRFFETAPPEIADALGRWLRVGRRARRACDALDAWIERQAAGIAPHIPAIIEPTGTVYDLDRLTRLVIEEHVAELTETSPRVTWGKRVRSRSVRSLHLGSYDHDADIVRLHPVLDHRDVPEFVVRFVLFHELLHAATPMARTTGGRNTHHPPEFRRRERAHPDYPRAVAWEERHLPSLIKRARRGW